MTSADQKHLLTARSVTWGGIVIDAALAVCKIAAGVTCRSQTILADGMHSASDLVTDLAVLGGLRVSNKPADRSHPYGHRRVTTLVALFIGAMLLAVGAWMGWRAINSVINPPEKVRADLPFWIAIAAVPLKELLYQITVRVGRRESDISLMANAWHHRSDALTSIAAAAGLAGMLIGGPSWCILDALTALVLSAFLIVIAGKIISDSASELIDQAPKPETLSAIERAVEKTDGVITFHAFRARQVGGCVEMDVHIQVDPSLTVSQGHEIASAVKYAVMQAGTPIIACTIHVEPAEPNALNLNHSHSD